MAVTADSVLDVIEEIAGDLANDNVSPVVASYGAAGEVLAATIQGLIGLFRKKSTTISSTDPVPTPLST